MWSSVSDWRRRSGRRRRGIRSFGSGWMRRSGRRKEDGTENERDRRG
jgi:hypothetical protein